MSTKSFFPMMHLVLLVFAGQHVFAQSSDQINLERKQMVERMDTQGLRFRKQAVTEKSKKLLKIPQSIDGLKQQFTVAKTAPTIELCVIPNKERCMADPPPEFHRTVWSNWGQGIFSELTQTYFAAFGNHRLHQARLYIVEYNSKTKTVGLTPEINQVLGNNSPNGYGEGKIHGWLDFFNGSELYFCTYWAHYPEPLEEHYQAGYEGSHIMSYNIITKKISDYGIPMPRVTWPYHRLDTKRGMLFAVGFHKQFLCYDLNKQKIRFAGFPQDSIMWNNRSMLVDEKTGYVYSTNTSGTDQDVHFIQYNPVTNKFKKMKSSVPPNEKDGVVRQMRAHTRNRSSEGWFIGVTKNKKDKKPGGQLFKFYPDEDRVERLSLCWPGQQRYTTSLALSPDEKYLYYLPGAHGKSHLEGCPVIQYNVKTGERKALAFLFPYFYDKYGYVPGGSFSINLDEQGERLFICINGQFIKYEEITQDIFGDPAIMVIHIPESER